MTGLSTPGSKFPKVFQYLLPATTTAMGLQLLHSFVPGISWYLRDVKLIATLDLLPYAFAPFLLALFAGGLRRLLGARLSLLLTSLGVALLRLIEQMSRNSEVDLWLSMAGLTFWLMFLQLFIGHTRSQGNQRSHRWVFGFVLGFAMELGLRALFGLRPLSGIDGAVPLMITALLAFAVLGAIWLERFDSDESYSDARWGSALSLAILGPFLLLQVLMLGSPGYLAEVAGLSPPLSSTTAILGYFVVCAGIYIGYRNPHALHPAVALIFAALLGAAIYLGDELGSYILLILIVTQAYAGFGLAIVGIANAKGVSSGIFRTTLMTVIGMILFLVVLFGFYAAQDIPFPFQRSFLPALAGTIMGFLIVQATWHVRRKPVTTASYAAAPITALAFLLIPLGRWIVVDRPPAYQDSSGNVVRVMTYNIHSGYNVDGQHDLEAIARVIEASEADIVGLQEVSRGRFMDASADMPYWLAQRLNMAYVFRGTEEPIWGNAILSRYPIIEWGWDDLPRAGQLIGRGYLWARIDVGGSEPLLVIVTHLHHLGPDSLARQEQVPDLLEFWNNEPGSILLGDLNAEPGSPEMDLIAEGGFQDAWELAGDGTGLTFSSDEPEKRIDWIWHTSDLSPLAMEVIQTQASDHMPVMTVLDLE